MFGFLKGKQKEKNNHNLESNCKHHNKNKNRRLSKDKKDRQKSKPNDARDASQSSNSFFKKSSTLPHQNNGTNLASSQQNLSNGQSSQSCASIDQLSSHDLVNSSSEVSDINSSCRNSFALSTSSSRASIPSIATEFVDDDSSCAPSLSTPTATKLNKPSVSEKKSPGNLALLTPKHQPSQRNLYGVSKDFQGFNSAMSPNMNPPNTGKPPVIPRSLPTNIDTNLSISRTLSNDDEDTSISSSIYSAPPSPVPVSMTSTSDLNSSRPTSPDGKVSLLSTPSTSNSSLSSLSIRPNSPSGRKTPPGPKMGTIAKMGASPTTTRKNIRTNIKTNPKISPGKPNSPIKQDEVKNAPVQPSTSTVLTAKQTSHVANNSNNPINSGTQHSETSQSHDIHDFVTSKPPTPAKPRHSVSSIQSLESIPESEIDLSVNRVGNSSNQEKIFSHQALTNSRNSSTTLPQVSEEQNEISNRSNFLSFSNGQSFNENSCNDDADISSSTQEFSVNEEINSTKESIVKEKQFENLIMRDYLDSRNDDESSESFREPEVKEHRLELIPDVYDLMNGLTFTTDKLTQADQIKTPNNEFGSDMTIADKTNNEPLSQSDPESSSSFSLKKAVPTHAVFQIPLRSKSCSRERSESPRPNLAPRDVSQSIGCRSSLEKEDPLHEVSNESPKEEETDVPCVEGHVELNFERGRRNEKISDTTRKRSLSSARRQKLYDDIKKFTAETKDLKINDGRGGRRHRSLDQRLASRKSVREDSTEPSKSNVDVARRELRECIRKRNTSPEPGPSRSRSTSSHRREVNTSPKVSAKRLERSITVSEIKVNVNGKQASPLRDSASLPSDLQANGETGKSVDINLRTAPPQLRSSKISEINFIHGNIDCRARRSPSSSRTDEHNIVNSYKQQSSNRNNSLDNQEEDSTIQELR